MATGMKGIGAVAPIKTPAQLQAEKDRKNKAIVKNAHASPEALAAALGNKNIRYLLPDADLTPAQMAERQRLQNKKAAAPPAGTMTPTAAAPAAAGGFEIGSLLKQDPLLQQGLISGEASREKAVTRAKEANAIDTGTAAKDTQRAHRVGFDNRQNVTTGAARRGLLHSGVLGKQLTKAGLGEGDSVMQIANALKATKAQRQQQLDDLGEVHVDPNSPLGYSGTGTLWDSFYQQAQQAVGRADDTAAADPSSGALSPEELQQIIGAAQTPAAPKAKAAAKPAAKPTMKPKAPAKSTKKSGKK